MLSFTVIGNDGDPVTAHILTSKAPSRPLAETSQHESGQEKMMELGSLDVCYLPNKHILWGPSLILVDPHPHIMPGAYSSDFF